MQCGLFGFGFDLPRPLHLGPWPWVTRAIALPLWHGTLLQGHKSYILSSLLLLQKCCVFNVYSTSRLNCLYCIWRVAAMSTTLKYANMQDCHAQIFNEYLMNVKNVTSISGSCRDISIWLAIVFLRTDFIKKRIVIRWNNQGCQNFKVFVNRKIFAFWSS